MSGGARQKTMAHMKKLLALAAATSATSAACTKEGSNDTIKADDKTKTTSTATTTTATTVTSTPSDSSTVTSPPTPPSPGYMVVDMLPPPAKCAGAAATITPTAAWKTSASGAMGIEVRLRKSTRPDVSYSSKTTPSGYGGTIVSTSLTGSEVVITLVPDVGATYAGLYVPLECKAGDERLNVELDLSAVTPGASPKSGTPVKVNIYDSY